VAENVSPSAVLATGIPIDSECQTNTLIIPHMPAHCMTYITFFSA
jgi:hypothetical protein